MHQVHNKSLCLKVVFAAITEQERGLIDGIFDSYHASFSFNQKTFTELVHSYQIKVGNNVAIVAVNK